MTNPTLKALLYV